MKFHTHEYDYKGHNLASTAVTLYYSGVGHSPSLSIIYSWWCIEWVTLITPHACARGKTIGLSICCRRRRRRRRWHENRQISSSRHLCVLKLQGIGRYQWKTGFCVLRIAEHGSLALQIVHFSFSMPVVYRPHPLHVLMWLDCACSTSMQVRIAKSWSTYSYSSECTM